LLFFLGDRIVHKAPAGGSSGASSSAPSDWGSQDAFPFPSSAQQQPDQHDDADLQQQRDRERPYATGRGRSQTSQHQQQPQTQHPHEDTIVNNSFIKVTRQQPAEIIVIG
jgi:hypothetical protein